MAIYANPFPIYQPSMRIVSAISKANPASVTTTFAHQYVTGTVVRLDIPAGFGMTQANQQFGDITVTSPTTFTIAIDTSLFDTFVVPTYTLLPSGTVVSLQQAQCVPIGELNLQLNAAVQNVLPYSAT